MKLPSIIDTNNPNANYFPSIQPQYANQGLTLGAKFRQFSSIIKLSDFDFTSQSSKLFTLPYILHSAAIVNNHAKPVSNLIHLSHFKKNKVTISMADSGGFQIAKGLLHPTRAKMLDIFDWQCEYADLSVTMDVPLGALKGKNSHIYSSFDKCHKTTIANLQEYKNWGAGKYRFLNVLQGRSYSESDDWYADVKNFNFYGWAFSFNCKMPMMIIISRIWHLINDGKFDRDEVWLHFLGAGDLKSAFMFTVIKQALNKRFPTCDVEVSFDTSTPFLLGGKHLSISLDPVITPQRMTIPNMPIDKEKQQEWMNNPEPLPCTSTKISQYVKKSDVVNCYKHKNEPWIDETSYLILQNHNVEIAIKAYEQVNAIYNDPITPYRLKVPLNLALAADEVFKILSEPNIHKSLSLLRESRTQIIINNMYDR